MVERYRFSRWRQILKTQTNQQPCAVSRRKPHPEPYRNSSTNIKLGGGGGGENESVLSYNPDRTPFISVENIGDLII